MVHITRVLAGTFNGIREFHPRDFQPSNIQFHLLQMPEHNITTPSRHFTKYVTPSIHPHPSNIKPIDRKVDFLQYALFVRGYKTSMR
mmetsp:Transcript_95543/g.265336  ORF Transcript_95543/g.265336 Transcript_95543/m.265336 type:complete len:87 (+) Transcript_95543:326-586(+)